jgi:hypothetical protein
MREIKCLLHNETVTCFESDGSGYIKYIKQDNSVHFAKAYAFVAYHIREYSHKFSRKLLRKLPINKDFWE